MALVTMLAGTFRLLALLVGRRIAIVIVVAVVVSAVAVLVTGGPRLVLPVVVVLAVALGWLWWPALANGNPRRRPDANRVDRSAEPHDIREP
jgi:membrane protein implicated in regulation of membrane protease activity